MRIRVIAGLSLQKLHAFRYESSVSGFEFGLFGDCCSCYQLFFSSNDNSTRSMIVQVIMSMHDNNIGIHPKIGIALLKVIRQAKIISPFQNYFNEHVSFNLTSCKIRIT
jgi:hypothetical protein